MWISSPACFWIAATTSGWQCPVEVTAMPAEKSKNSFPSTSVTTIPRPLFATSGYDRVYDGEIYFSSPSSTRLAFGPGRAVLILGPIVALVVMVAVVIESSVSAPNRSWEGHDFSRAVTRRKYVGFSPCGQKPPDRETKRLTSAQKRK